MTAHFNSDAFNSVFTHDKVEANGIKLHVVSGGTGQPLVLVHGFLSTWLVWARVMPSLARDYRVIVPDLRGFGDSERTLRGYDKTTLAKDVLGVLDAWGINRFLLAGHDFGAQVAYRMATLARARVERLAVIEGLLPEIAVTAPIDPVRFWFYTFNQVADLPEMLAAGNERRYLEHFYQDFLYDRSCLPAAEMDEYVRCYGQPGGLRAGFELYRTVGEDIEAFRSEYPDKLAMPVFALSGADSFGELTLETFAQVASDVRGEVLERCGHFVPLERPDETLALLTPFLNDTMRAAA
jgi:pimeloyl-ACP methyl ester carboxylesterase